MVPASIAAAAIGTGTAGDSSTPTGTATTGTTTTTAAADAAAAARAAAARRKVIRRIAQLRRTTWRWEQLMGVRRTGSANRDLESAGYATLVAVHRKWRRFAQRARRRAQHPPHLSAWLCIHRYEASWRDRGAPYYGGLQMDWSFMSHYGRDLLRRKGDASRWTPLEQMWVAERAHRSGRGFYPWPNAASACGLI